MAPAPLLNTAEQEPHNQPTSELHLGVLPTHQSCELTIASRNHTHLATSVDLGYFI